MTQLYQVRFTSRDTGRSHVESYRTAKRAREVVDLTYQRHTAANTDAEYLGARSGWSA